MASNRDYRPVLGGICFSWFYSLAWTVPPLLGWSSYGPEGPGTTCSVDWRTQTPNNISYIVCLFTFCLLLPFCVILYSYSKLLHTIRQVSSSSASAPSRGGIPAGVTLRGFQTLISGSNAATIVMGILGSDGFVSVSPAQLKVVPHLRRLVEEQELN